MDILIDTDVLVRRVSRHHPEHKIVRDAIKRLQGNGQRVCVVAQNLYELWVVCTRPCESRGLGLIPSQADKVLARIERSLTLLQDPSGLYTQWRTLVVQQEVSGRKAHDTRLVAAMNLHGITSILTFNVDDFRRYPNIAVLRPDQV
jgi:predicted nucleic acid-binding protein